jgi:hypothetical protein
MFDTASLARSLGISVTAVKNRAVKLGLVPEEVSCGRGRPKQIWSPEQAQAIGEYGQPVESAGNEEWIEDSEQSGQLAVNSAQGEIALVVQSQLTGFDSQCESLEDRLGEAIAARAAVVIPRAWQKASLILKSGAMGCDLAGFGSIPLTPRAKAIVADRFPAQV